MKERIRKTTTDLTYEEIEKVLNRVEGIFKGGVTFKNVENLKENMTNYYKSFN